MMGRSQMLAGRSLAFIAAALAVLEAAPPVGAASDAPRALSNETPTFLAIEFGSSAALTLALSLSVNGASECRWCAPGSLDRSLRDAVYSRDSRTPAVISHVTALGLSPLVALAAVVVPALGSDHPSYALADGLVIVDTTLLVTAMGDLTKKTTARERPAFYFGREGETEATPSAKNRSFFSLDTGWAFTFCAASATLAYERGYWTAPYVIAAGGVLGVASGTLRMMADMHWFSDVVVGAAVGVGAGVAFPLLVHPRRGAAERLTWIPVLTPTFTGFGMRGTWL